MKTLLKIELQSLFKTLQSATDTISTTFPTVDLHELIAFINCEHITYFKSKYEDYSFLGAGVARYLSAKEAEEIYLHRSDLTVFVAGNFESMKKAQFILPEWQFTRRGNAVRLVIHKNEDNTFSPPELLFDLNTFEEYIPAPWTSVEENPDPSTWAGMIERASQLFEEETLEKIVLSRQKVFEYEFPIDGRLLFLELLKQNDFAKNSYALYHQQGFAESFISFTPEKLFSLKGSQLETISLAGSAPRGQTPEEDLNFEKQLASDSKLVREHEIVTKEILRKLTPFCEAIQTLGTQVMKLPYIQHQSNPIRAQLKQKTTPVELINVLHPTPAVGGLPEEKARDFIRELEPYERGQYAAPIGIINHDFSECAVGIRSATVENNIVRVFGGAGIVKGSDAELEWKETGTKMNPFLKVINNG